MKGLERFWKNQKGAIAVIIAIVASVLIGFTAFAVDIGYLYEVRRQLQSAADAAALAGAQELINQATDSEILAVAEDYAKKNDFQNDIGTSEELWMYMTPPATEIGDNYVKVTVEKNVSLFFARIFGLLKSPVQAQAKAQIVYLTGAKDLVPWGLNVIISDYATVTAKIGDEPEEILQQNGVTFSGDLQIPTLASQTGYPVTVKISYDNYDTFTFPEVSEIVAPAGNVIIHQSNDPIKEVSLSENFVYGGEKVELKVGVSTGSGTPEFIFNGKKYSMNFISSDGQIEVFSAMITAPSITNPIDYFPIDVSVGSGAAGFKIVNAATLVVRRSTYPVLDVSLGKTNFEAGSGETAHIDVTLNVLEEWKEYDLKVVAGPETGNFNALDYRYVYCYKADPPYSNMGENQDAQDYYLNVEGNYSGLIHIGDIIETKTGNLSGPQTENALLDRFDDHNHSFQEWFLDRHDSCPRIVFVPIVEKIDRGTGKSEVIVVNFAAFYITQYEKTTGNIKGVFIPDIHPGVYDDDPPSGSLSVRTARLVSPDF